MADNVMIDLGGLSDYTPYEGLGSNDLLTHDGIFKVKLTKLVPGTSKGSGNPKFTVQQVVVDEDNKGKNLVSTVLLGGVDSKGGKLVRQLGDLLTSVGMSTEAIRALSAKGAINAAELAVSLTGKDAYVQAEAEMYEGTFASKFSNYRTAKEYNDAVAAGAHRKPHRAQQSMAGTPGGGQTSASSGIVNLGGAPASTPANGAASGNALGKLQSLNLGL